MTKLYELQKGHWRKVQCVSSPKKESFVISTVNYKKFGYETLVFKSSRQGDVDDYRAVFQYKCTNIEEAQKRHDVICTLLRQGKYLWTDKYDIYFI